MLAAISNKAAAMWSCGNARLKREMKADNREEAGLHFACEGSRKIAKSCHGDRVGTGHAAGAAVFVVASVVGGDILRL